MEKVRITVLVDNQAMEGLEAEWGLSFYIEFRGSRYLLDMGASGLFAKNADRLEIPLSDVDAGILSHAHYDHSDGMPVFFERNQKARVFLREGAGENCYGPNDEGELHYIGIREGILEEFSSRIAYAKGDFELAPDVWLIPHKTPGLESIGRMVRMKVRRQDHWETDRFDHEQSLVLRTDHGLIVFNSCSHGGPQNILSEVKATFPGEPVLAYLGGLHQFKAAPAQVKALAERLAAMETGHIYTGHCTGDEAFRILKEVLGDRLSQFCSGFQVEL